MTDYPDEQSRKLGEWMDAADNIAEGDEHQVGAVRHRSDTQYTGTLERLAGIISGNETIGKGGSFGVRHVVELN